MNTRITINPVMRSLLVISGIAGIASIMFFKGTLPGTNLLALTFIIPLIIGMLGDNLFKALVYKEPQDISKSSTNQKRAIATALYPSPLNNTDPLEKRAA